MAIQLPLLNLSLAQIVGYAFLSYCVYVSPHPLSRSRSYADSFSQYLLSIIFCLYFHSLAQYPGPLLARVSVWPSFWHTLKGNRHIWLWQLQEIYGNIMFLVDPVVARIPWCPRPPRNIWCSILCSINDKYNTDSLQDPSSDTGRMHSFSKPPPLSTKYTKPRPT